MLSDLYHDLILEHAKRPRLKGELASPSAHLTLQNPLCGDELGISVIVEGERIKDARFTGHGCTISQAAGSMLTELLVGRTLDEGKKLAADYRAMLCGETESSSLGDLVALEGVKKFPTRLKCALLAAEVAQKVLGPEGLGQMIVGLKVEPEK